MPSIGLIHDTKVCFDAVIESNLRETGAFLEALSTDRCNAFDKFMRWYLKAQGVPRSQV
jgi:hypothetical protein